MANWAHGERNTGCAARGLNAARVAVHGVGPLLLIGSIAAMAATQALHERLCAEWQYPIYLNRSTAALCLVRRDSSMAPLLLTVSFEAASDGRTPAAPVTARFAPGQTRIDLAVRIAAWPDGDYVTSVREDGADASGIVRTLCKQTLPRPEPPAGPMNVAGITMLFVDDWRIARMDGLERRVHAAETFAVTTGMLEADRPYQTARELSLEPDGSVAVRFYTMDRRRRNHRFYVARSRDLEQWDLTQDAANTPPTHGAASSPVGPLWRWHDPRGTKAEYRLYEPETDPAPGLARIHVQYSGWSSEPTHWGLVPISARSTYPVWRVSDTDYCVLSARPLTTDNHRFAEGRIGRWTDTNDNWGGQWPSADGQRLYFCQARVIPRHDPFRVHYDNIAGSRILVVWTTSDGIAWTPTCFCAPEDGDPEALQFYGATGFPAERGQLRLAYLWVYDAVRQQIGLELAWSRNHLLWERFHGQPRLVDFGTLGSWCFGMAAPMPGEPLCRAGLFRPQPRAVKPARRRAVSSHRHSRDAQRHKALRQRRFGVPAA